MSILAFCFLLPKVKHEAIHILRKKIAQQFFQEANRFVHRILRAKPKLKKAIQAISYWHVLRNLSSEDVQLDKKLRESLPSSSEKSRRTWSLEVARETWEMGNEEWVMTGSEWEWLWRSSFCTRPQILTLSYLNQANHSFERQDVQTWSVRLGTVNFTGCELDYSCWSFPTSYS